MWPKKWPIKKLSAPEKDLTDVSADLPLHFLLIITQEKQHYPVHLENFVSELSLDQLLSSKRNYKPILL